jgi:hypothetical protein
MRQVRDKKSHMLARRLVQGKGKKKEGRSLNRSSVVCCGLVFFFSRERERERERKKLGKKLKKS